ncbi:helix-turn-helix transcriptional regulator [Sphaerisporangium rubeum]|uniref:Transcriptional regulator with XRE-family HTH domain n=1 Tax=Sphaerisporangium rubeum TaxID=321317 RepID=A0A7X0I9Y9_9ACTN|nr:helix-turn-helix transcriptional regulator [Sphaerisporangium rubeum]MBB6471331.1 transcriptional regulator with XRE-family HTH domain [Sphaerisporangium rubeum]
MSDPDSPSKREIATPVARFGAEMRRFRESLSLSQDALAARLGCTQTQVSRLEQGSRRPHRDHAVILDRVFGLSDKGYFAMLHRRILSHPEGPRWWLDWPEEIEPRAKVIRSWDPLLVPGVLQTEAYARCLLSREPQVDPDEVERRMHARLQRRAVLDRTSPPLFVTLMDEGVLHRRIGSPEVMREQLTFLMEVADRPNVTVQVVDPACVSGLLGAFMIAQLPNGEPDTIYADSPAEGLLTSESEVVSTLWSRYELIRAWAYPEHVSLQKIQDVMHQWT